MNDFNINNAAPNYSSSQLSIPLSMVSLSTVPGLVRFWECKAINNAIYTL